MTASPSVLDASVLVKCFLSEEHSDIAADLVASRDDWIAPDLILLEVANVALKALRRGVIDRDAAAIIVHQAPRMVLTLVSSSDIVREAWEMAATHGFSAYDASYMAVARDRNGVLVTADQRLRDRAQAAGLGAYVRLLGGA